MSARAIAIFFIWFLSQEVSPALDPPGRGILPQGPHQAARATHLLGSRKVQAGLNQQQLLFIFMTLKENTQVSWQGGFLHHASDNA
jgi:hypothetical protein